MAGENGQVWTQEQPAPVGGLIASFQTSSAGIWEGGCSVGGLRERERVVK